MNSNSNNFNFTTEFGITISDHSPILVYKKKSLINKYPKNWIQKRLFEIEEEYGEEKIRTLALEVLEKYLLFTAIKDYKTEKQESMNIETNIAFGNKNVPVDKVSDAIHNIIKNNYGLSKELPKEAIKEVLEHDAKKPENESNFKKIIKRGTLGTIAFIAAILAFAITNPRYVTYVTDPGVKRHPKFDYDDFRPENIIYEERIPSEIAKKNYDSLDFDKYGYTEFLDFEEKDINTDFEEKDISSYFEQKDISSDFEEKGISNEVVDEYGFSTDLNTFDSSDRLAQIKSGTIEMDAGNWQQEFGDWDLDDMEMLIEIVEVSCSDNGYVDIELLDWFAEQFSIIKKMSKNNENIDIQKIFQKANRDILRFGIITVKPNNIRGPGHLVDLQCLNVRVKMFANVIYKEIGN